MTPMYGLRCAKCGTRFSMVGPEDELKSMRCQCSPDKPLDVCGDCIAEGGKPKKTGKHEPWCASEHADDNRKEPKP